jgi:MFS family permease
VSEALPEHRRTLGLGVVITAYQASAITGQLYGQAVGEATGWRSVYLLLAIGFLLVTVILVRRLHEPRERSPGETDGLALLRGIARLLRSFMLDAGTSGGAWLSVRLSWPELCSGIAAAVAAAALLVALAVRTERAAGWVPESQP